MAEIAYWEAIRRAHDEELANDKMVIAMGACSLGLRLISAQRPAE